MESRSAPQSSRSSIEMESRCAPQSRNVELPSGGEEAAHLPEEVVMKEILPKLPVKSLLRFRCVSKYWCSLIGSKSFIRQHLKHSIRMSRFAQRLVFYNEPEQEFQQCSLPSLFDKSGLVTCNAADLEIDLESEFIFESGCCNGLFCIRVKDDVFILWNPTTKKFRYLPSLFDEIQVEYGNNELGIVAYGFGFDELNDDYKVYGMVNQVDEDNEPIRCIVMIYSLKSNSWKVIEERDASPDNELGMGEYVSGKLHWFRREGYESEIVSFDLNSHVYGVVELPSYTNGFLDRLGVVGGCLSVHYFHPNAGTDVWLMKEYGVKESFDKVATVPYHPDSFGIPTALVAISPNGEVLLAYASTIMIYDLKSDVFRHPHITGIDGDIHIFHLNVYIESLASVDPDTEQKR